MLNHLLTYGGRTLAEYKPIFLASFRLLSYPPSPAPNMIDLF